MSLEIHWSLSLQTRTHTSALICFLILWEDNPPKSCHISHLSWWYVVAQQWKLMQCLKVLCSGGAESHVSQVDCKCPMGKKWAYGSHSIFLNTMSCKEHGYSLSLQWFIFLVLSFSLIFKEHIRILWHTHWLYMFHLLNMNLTQHVFIFIASVNASFWSHNVDKHNYVKDCLIEGWADWFSRSRFTLLSECYGWRLTWPAHNMQLFGQILF